MNDNDIDKINKKLDCLQKTVDTNYWLLAITIYASTFFILFLFVTLAGK